MDNFPKKYNPNKTLRKKNENYGWVELFSNNIPVDQNINPGVIFSMYYKDIYCKTLNIYKKNDQEKIQNKTGFTLSSLYHSALETENKKNTQTHIEKKIKKNISFLENLWLNIDKSPANFSMTERFNQYLRSVFSDLYNKKKLINEQNLIYWSKTSQTNISETNLEKREIDVPSYSIKYFIEAKWQTINVRTTRLETIFADVAIAVNPMDKRYKKLIWQNVIIPIINKIIPIIWEESVNIFDWEWAIRITPWHDKYGLDIAKKHGLPIDVFAIDTNGNFTENAWEFAWKNVSEFYDNIVKYIDDIWNLNSQWIAKETRFFNKNTWEELFPICMKQWTLPYWYSKDFLLDMVKNDWIFKDQDWDNDFLYSTIENKTNFNISKKSSNGILLPFAINSEKNLIFSIDDKSILEIYNQKKTKKDIVMTLIILNLILDNQLNPVFSLEDLVDVLFSRNFLWNNTKIWEYLDIYSELSSSNSLYKSWLKSLKSCIESIEKNSEKISDLIDILKENFWIQVENNEISINFHDFFGETWLSIEHTNSFNKGFIDSCSFLYRLNCIYDEKPYVEIKAENRKFIENTDDCGDFLDVCLLALEYSKRLLFSELIYHPFMVDDKWQKINNYNSKFLNKDFYENLNLYGENVLRLVISLWDEFNENSNFIVFNTYSANEYRLLLDKIWNANRYIFSKFREKFGQKKVKLSEILEWIDLENISDYDARILQDLKIVLDDFNYENAENNNLSLWKKIIQNYSSFFCDKYINITKILKSHDTNMVLFAVNFIFLELLYPYIPDFITEIKEKFNIDVDNVDFFNMNIFEIKDKNYKINVFLDLIDKINYLKQKIWIKKHEFVNIFVQANPDFLQFLQSSESVFRLLAKIQDINLYKLFEEIPSWYEVDNVINISIWIKKPEVIKVEVKKDIVAELENEYKNKQEHLQHLKSLFASIYWNAWDDLVSKKRQEISDLQAEIEDLEFRIWRLKVKNE